MQQDLQVAALQQNFQETRALEIAQWLMPQANQQGLIGALLEQVAGDESFLRIKPPVPDDGLDQVEPFIAFCEKMLEAKVLAGKNNDALAAALVISAARLDLSFCRGSCGMQTIFRVKHCPSRFLSVTNEANLLKLDGILPVNQL